MQKLEDIVLEKGDIVYFKNKYKTIVDIYDNKNVKEVYGDYLSKIVKIERPHYETIYEAPKEILTQKEKEYLEAVIRPFKDRIICIAKQNGSDLEWIDLEWIYIELEGLGIESDNEDICLPFFTKDTMYKGMELGKEYTLEELGLF